jgi:hypothetical protein
MAFFGSRRATAPSRDDLIGRQMRPLAKGIQKHGWIAVPVQPPQEDLPGWFYTAGFEETLGHPELIIFDVPADVAAREFHIAFETLKRGGSPFEDGMVLFQDEQAKTVLRSVHPERLAHEGWLTLAQERLPSNDRLRGRLPRLPDRLARPELSAPLGSGTRRSCARHAA